MTLLNTRDTQSCIYLDAVRIRHIVFVEEQRVPLEIEMDAYETQCVHFVLYNEDKVAVATARLLPDRENAGLVILQRMAVLSEQRGNGYGRKVIEAVEKYAKQHQFSEIVLHAQLTAHDFYAKMGYMPFGDEFEEAGIRHISMKKK
ncbi:MAG: GNAT family N-acetyltransferase [Candidatus Symbiothrix sp.]|jgi:predicted GNAT family N-acyltransferase|nr:GNAT family N-acetyltransferase [Candidatus Symbiothrix sp.]